MNQEEKEKIVQKVKDISIISEFYRNAPKAVKRAIKRRDDAGEDLGDLVAGFMLDRWNDYRYDD